MGDALPGDFLYRDDYRHGIDHDRDRDTADRRVEANVFTAPAARHRLGTAQFRLRPIPRLSDRDRRSAFRRCANLDSALSTDAPLSRGASLSRKNPQIVSRARAFGLQYGSRLSHPEFTIQKRKSRHARKNRSWIPD